MFKVLLIWGGYLYYWIAYTTFDGGSNSDLQRTASRLHNELARFRNNTNILAWLLGYLGDLERRISNLTRGLFVGRYNNFRLEDIYSLSDTRFYELSWLNFYHGYDREIRLIRINDGSFVVTARTTHGPPVFYIYNLDDLFNLWEYIR